MPRAVPVDRDQRLLVFIANHIDENGYAPTYRRMAEEFGIAIKSVRDSLTRLRDNGEITWEEGLTRTLRIVQNVPAE